MATADRRAFEKARRRDEILQAARVVFAEAGSQRATVDAVAERAQVSKGTIYLYFESKEAIVGGLVLQALAELRARLQAAGERAPVLHPDERLRAMADAYLAFAEDAPDYYRLLTAYDSLSPGLGLAPARTGSLTGQGGAFPEGIAREQQEDLLAESNRSLELVSQVIADGMALGIFVPGDARQSAAVLWAALNGALALLAHPVRRNMVSVSARDFYRATFDLFLRGIHCLDDHCGERLASGPEAGEFARAGQDTLAADGPADSATDRPATQQAGYPSISD